MSTDDMDPEEQAVADRLRSEAPHPSPALRRRVRDRISVANARQGLRGRAMALTGSGALLLTIALLLATRVS